MKINAKKLYHIKINENKWKVKRVLKMWFICPWNIDF